MESKPGVHTYGDPRGNSDLQTHTNAAAARIKDEAGGEKKRVRQQILYGKNGGVGMIVTKSKRFVGLVTKTQVDLVRNDAGNTFSVEPIDRTEIPKEEFPDLYKVEL